MRRARAHPPQQHQRQRRHARVDRAQRASAALLALAHAAAERQRPGAARDAPRLSTRAVPARRARAARGEPVDRVHHRHHGRVPRRDRRRPRRDAVTRRRGRLPPGSRLPLVAATGNARRRRSTAGWTTPPRGVAAPRCDARPGAPARRRSPRACGRVHEVAWDAVDGDACPRPHRRVSRGRSWRARSACRQGGLDLVRADSVEGDRLRATLLRS